MVPIIRCRRNTPTRCNYLPWAGILPRISSLHVTQITDFLRVEMRCRSGGGRPLPLTPTTILNNERGFPDQVSKRAMPQWQSSVKAGVPDVSQVSLRSPMSARKMLPLYTDSRWPHRLGVQGSFFRSQECFKAGCEHTISSSPPV